MWRSDPATSRATRPVLVLYAISRLLGYSALKAGFAQIPRAPAVPPSIGTRDLASLTFVERGMCCALSLLSSFASEGVS